MATTRRRRRPPIASGAVLALVIAVGIGAAVLQLVLPWWLETGNRVHEYENDAGSRHYQVHLPPQHDVTTRPGCR